MKRIGSFLLSLILVLSLCPVLRVDAEAYSNPMYSVIDKTGSATFSNIVIPNDLNLERYYLSIYDAILMGKGQVKIVDPKSDLPRTIGIVFDCAKTTINSYETTCPYCGSTKIPKASAIYTNGYAQEGRLSSSYYYNTPILYNTLDIRPLVNPIIEEYNATGPEYLAYKEIDSRYTGSIVTKYYGRNAYRKGSSDKSEGGNVVTFTDLTYSKNTFDLQPWVGTFAKTGTLLSDAAGENRYWGKVSLSQAQINSRYPTCKVPYYLMGTNSVVNNAITVEIYPCVRNTSNTFNPYGQGIFKYKNGDHTYNVSWMNGHDNFAVVDINYIKSGTKHQLVPMHPGRFGTASLSFSSSVYAKVMPLPYNQPIVNASGTPITYSTSTCVDCSKSVRAYYISTTQSIISQDGYGGSGWNSGFSLSSQIGETHTSGYYQQDSYGGETPGGVLDYSDVFANHFWLYGPDNGNAMDAAHDITCTVTGITFDGCTISSLPIEILSDLGHTCE